MTELDAVEAVAHIKNGDLTAESYASGLIRQLNAHKSLNAVNWIDEGCVLEAARAVDLARKRGETPGPAAGLPVAVKDQIEVAGFHVSGGNGALRGYVPRRNAVVVDRLVRAGAIPFCMTACPDMVCIDGLMHQLSSYSAAFGAVRNPYDQTRIPGGSSGGSGAVLAARIAPAALGEDTNGSVRVPSAHCGTTGLRPSTFTLENAVNGTRRKRYSDEGLMIPPASRLDTIGPMARTAADVAFLDAIITGEQAPAVDLRNARIAIPNARYWEMETADEGVAAVIRTAFEKLRDAGCTLVEIDFEKEVFSLIGTLDNPTMLSLIALFGLKAPNWVSGATVAPWLRENAPDVTVEQAFAGRPLSHPLLEPPPLPSNDEQKKIANEAARRYADIYRTHNVSAMAFPTIPIPATPIWPEGPQEPLGRPVTIRGRPVLEGRAAIQNVIIAPRFGAPGLSLPAGLTSGLPVGLELDALPGTDSALLGLGIAVQKVLGRIPPPL